MLDWKYISNISRLIEKQILGNISDEESAQLDEWRKKSAANEELYSKTVDETFLRVECQRHKLINSDRAKQDMIHRIGNIDSRRRRMLIFKSAAITAISIAAIWTVVFFALPYINNSTITNKMQGLAQVEAIKAGSTKAILTLAF